MVKISGYEPRLADNPEGANGWVRVTAELYLTLVEKAFPDRDDISVYLSEPDPQTGEVEVANSYRVTTEKK
jgi:hypothetical protein